jgi:TM2 domain-containing membrane protein YozV
MSAYKQKEETWMYCSSCGEIIKKDSEICPKCGVRLKTQNTVTLSRWTILLLLSLFFGAFGADRFYVGKIGTGVLKLLTLGGCGIWSLIDLILLLMGKFKDKDGNYIKNE